MSNSSPDTDIFGPKAARTRKFTYFIIWLERIIISLGPLFAWLGAYTALYLFVSPNISIMTGNLLTLGFYACAFGLIVYGFLRLKAPSGREIDERLAKSNDLKYNPLLLLRDHLANPFRKMTRRIWATQISKAYEQSENLRLPRPRFQWIKHDKYALRFALILALICAFITSGHNWDKRLNNAFIPDISAFLFPSDSKPVLKVIPPEYTALQSRLYEYNSQNDEIVNIPQGSTLEIKVSAYRVKPKVSFNNHSYPMTPDSGDLYTYNMKPKALADTPADKTMAVKVTHGFFTRASWETKVIADQPPEVMLTEPPVETRLQALSLPLTLKDDYGVRHLELRINPGEVMLDPPLGDSLTRQRLVKTKSGQTNLSPVFDLTDHSWAGLPAKITLTAIDDKNQRSDPVEMETILPERSFEHPIAKRLVEFRKKLAWRPVHAAASTAYEIRTLLMFPEEMQNDSVVFLGLQSAATRLENNPSIETARETIDLLWALALKLEDGNLTLARRALERAHRELSDALENKNLSEKQAKDKLDGLRGALNDYVKELSRELHKQSLDPEASPRIMPDIVDKALDKKALTRFLNRLEDSVLSGDKNKSEELLSQLQDLMDMLDPSLAESMPRDMQNMVASVNELQELINNLRDLKFLTKELADKLEPKHRGTRSPDAPLFKHKDGLSLHNSPDAREIPDTLRPDLDSFPPMPDSIYTPEQGTQPSIQTPPEEPDHKKKISMDKKTSQPYEDKEEEQKALRYVLGFLMKESGVYFGQVPPNMGEAELLLRDAENLLLSENARDAVPVQQEAIEKLQQAQKQMADKLREMMEKQPQMAGEPRGTDPLGRPERGQGEKGPFGDEHNRGLPGALVEIPDESRKRYVQDILRQLRERAGELNRPEYELDYLNRLLEQF